ncbi:hypothetical protein DM50_1751 [Burkholderia mallei]|nr:hypothetical protein DM75_1956 [Burkholderia mallei]KOS89125.1 hypothetical protein DM45_1373 [Burkholderia mallei]KOS97578.1 hypothetical protein DM50_1751 [Burkholderia mallei]KOT10356.1 hypothetical protein DM77_2617 [Burkholderia mallei]KOT21748.1 hypothetical protein DM52_1657 [Burkholderia mallei]
MSVRAVAGATARAGAVRFRRRFSVFVGWFCVFSLLAVRRSTLDALFSELCTWHRHRRWRWRWRWRWRQYLALGYRHSVPGSRLSALGSRLSALGSRLSSRQRSISHVRSRPAAPDRASPHENLR